VLKPETVDAAGNTVAEVAVAYGTFIQAAIDFLLVALVIFLFLKAYNRVRRPAHAAAPAAPPEDALLLREIRDALRAHSTAWLGAQRRRPRDCSPRGFLGCQGTRHASRAVAARPSRGLSGRGRAPTHPEPGRRAADRRAAARERPGRRHRLERD